MLDVLIRGIAVLVLFLALLLERRICIIALLNLHIDRVVEAPLVLRVAGVEARVVGLI